MTSTQTIESSNLEPEDPAWLVRANSTLAECINKVLFGCAQNAFLRKLKGIGECAPKHPDQKAYLCKAGEICFKNGVELTVRRKADSKPLYPQRSQWKKVANKEYERLLTKDSRELHVTVLLASDGAFSLLKGYRGHHFDEALRHNIYRENQKMHRQIVVYRVGPECVAQCFDGVKHFEMAAKDITSMMHGMYDPKAAPERITYRNADVEKKKLFGKGYLAQPSLNRLESVHAALTADYDGLREATGGFVDMYLAKSDAHMAQNLFGMYTSMIWRKPDPIGSREAKWIRHCTSGGLIFAEPCVLKKGYSYDVNKMYSSVLKSIEFPWQKGEFKCIDKLSDSETDKWGNTVIPELTSYGIYRVEISGKPHRLVHKGVFRSKYHTHYDIKTAVELGLTVTLLPPTEKEPYNALVYTEGRMRGSAVFARFFNMMGFNKEVTGSKIAKSIMNTLWGSLCQKRYLTHDSSGGPLDLEGKEIVAIEPSGGDTERIVMVDYGKRYKYDYARIGPFVTSRGRRKMFELLKPFGAHVKRIHTDGFVSGINLKGRLKLSSKMGDWKLEKKGPCQIKNGNVVMW